MSNDALASYAITNATVDGKYLIRHGIPMTGIVGVPAFMVEFEDKRLICCLSGATMKVASPSNLILEVTGLDILDGNIVELTNKGKIAMMIAGQFTPRNSLIIMREILINNPMEVIREIIMTTLRMAKDGSLIVFVGEESYDFGFLVASCLNVKGEVVLPILSPILEPQNNKHSRKRHSPRPGPTST